MNFTLLQKLVTLFVSKENGVVVQDTVPMSSTYLTLLGVDVPYFIILKKSSEDKVRYVDLFYINKILLYKLVSTF